MSRPLGQIRTQSLVLRALFEDMDRRSIAMRTVAFEMEIEPTRMSEWRAGKVMPSVLNVERMALLLGLELKLQLKQGE